VLRAYAKNNAQTLGLDPSLGAISAPSFHPMFHPSEDGSLFVDMVVELVQTIRVKFNEKDESTFPMRSGVTLLIAQDPPALGVRPDPRIRFVIAKHHSAEREARLRNYYALSDRAIGSGDERFQIDFGLLHARL
jgi:hypothetical protein